MDCSKFTADFKDDILRLLCESLTPYKLERITWKELCPDSQLLNTCLMQFQERGLITQFSLRHASPVASIIITSTAIDFMNMGGFAMEKKVFETEIQKAILELQKLQSDPKLKQYVEQISGITGILSNAISAFYTITGGTI